MLLDTTKEEVAVEGISGTKAELKKIVDQLWRIGHTQVLIDNAMASLELGVATGKILKVITYLEGGEYEHDRPSSN